MTPTEISAHAIELGITKEAFPELWESDCATCDMSSDVCFCGLSDYVPVWHCTLPAPDSDDPRACLWEPFYMRALDALRRPGELNLPRIRQEWAGQFFTVVLANNCISGQGPTPTAALRAAWLAKGAKT